MLQTITSLGQLTELASRQGGLECFIALNYGIKSSKIIQYFNGKRAPYYIHNLIDDTKLHLTKKEIMDKSITLVGEAICKNALLYEN
jgi:hypothetical protein